MTTSDLSILERALSGQEITSEEAEQASEAVAALREGPTLRDRFAMAALQGLLANENANASYHGYVIHAASEAYQVADAMLAERAKPRGEAP